ncbi:hypothetical protein FF38_04900 [Lucilia cuprina]|uniref:Uncharacterized protein n=1 Tax=Lucilia cuprina TaxID=7375 RepID=A0A0L0C8T5_LUCCU|nr:hypothetical protein FF38_04900 [Lucilia cuprina]
MICMIIIKSPCHHSTGTPYVRANEKGKREKEGKTDDVAMVFIYFEKKKYCRCYRRLMQQNMCLSTKQNSTNTFVESCELIIKDHSNSDCLINSNAKCINKIKTKLVYIILTETVWQYFINKLCLYILIHIFLLLFAIPWRDEQWSSSSFQFVRFAFKSLREPFELVSDSQIATMGRQCM